MLVAGCGRLGFEAIAPPGDANTDGTPGDGALGLIDHWTFDEGTGGTAADSVGGITATLNGAVWGTGRINSAVDLDGVADYVDLAGECPLGTGAATVSAWVYTRSIPNVSQYATIISFGFQGLECGVQDYSTNRYACSHDSFLTPALSADSALLLDQWQLLAVTRDAGGRLTIYVDGLRSGSADQDGGPAKIGTFGSAIGASGDDQDDPFDGLIDDVRLFGRALSASEIAGL